MARTIAILGSGGHAAVVRDACETAGFTVVAFVVEESFPAASPAPDGVRLLIDRSQPIDARMIGTSSFALGIGNNESRLWWADKLLREGFQLPAIVHSHAWVSPLAKLGEGVFIGAGAVVQAQVTIGRAALVNTHATVEHHCSIGAGAHVGPGAVLAGLVEVGEQTMIGAGAVVKDRILLGAGSIVGAGAAVIRNVPIQATVVGVPAKPLEMKE